MITSTARLHMQNSVRIDLKGTWLLMHEFRPSTEKKIKCCKQHFKVLKGGQNLKVIALYEYSTLKVLKVLTALIGLVSSIFISHFPSFFLLLPLLPFSHCILQSGCILLAHVINSALQREELDHPITIRCMSKKPTP